MTGEAWPPVSAWARGSIPDSTLVKACVCTISSRLRLPEPQGLSWFGSIISRTTLYGCPNYLSYAYQLLSTDLRGPPPSSQAVTLSVPCGLGIPHRQWQCAIPYSSMKRYQDSPYIFWCTPRDNSFILPPEKKEEFSSRMEWRRLIHRYKWLLLFSLSVTHIYMAARGKLPACPFLPNCSAWHAGIYGSSKYREKFLAGLHLVLRYLS